MDGLLTCMLIRGNGMDLISLQKAMNICLAFLFIALMVSCKVDPNGESFPDYFRNANAIELERIPFSPANTDVFFRNMFGLGYMDSVVIVNEYVGGEYAFKIVDLKSGLIKEFGKRGEGPYELISPNNKFFLDYEKSQVHITDEHFYYSYDVESLIDSVPQPIESFTVNLEEGNHFMGNRTFLDGNLVGATLKKRFGAYNISEEKLTENEEYPGGPSQALAHQAYFTAQPFGSKAAYGVIPYPEFGIIQLGDDSGLEVKKWNWGVNDSQFVTEDSQGTMALRVTEEDRYEFISLASSRTSLFLLYAGKEYRKDGRNLEGFEVFPDTIYQLDWEGNPVAILKLDQQVKSICVDPEGKLLFAASISQDPELLIYKLP